MIARSEFCSKDFAHAYFLSDEESDVIRLGLLFDEDGSQIVCKVFNERSHGTMPEALSALVSEARKIGVEEVRVTMLRETGAFRITLNEDAS